MGVMQILLASGNQGKLDELRRILPRGDFQLLSLLDVPPYPEPAESGCSFTENALIKARAGALHTGLPTVADDSGLSVDALNGMPGILSARWCGHHGDDARNIELLLAQLHDVSDDRRGASFVSVCALVYPGGPSITAEGTWAGSITREPRGEFGFGYDPIFVPNGDTRTAAQLSPREKNRVSHRARAMEKIVRKLRGDFLD